VVKLVSDLYRKCTAGLVRIPRLALVFVLQVWSKPVKLHRRRPRPGLRVRFFSSSTIAPLGPFELVANPREKDWSSMNPSSSPSSTSKMSEPPAPSTFTFQATFGNMTDSQLHQTISRFSSATNRPVPRFRRPAGGPLTQYVPLLTVVPNQLSSLSHSQSIPKNHLLQTSAPRRVFAHPLAKQ
jgi:hypothetical protein